MKKKILFEILVTSFVILLLSTGAFALDKELKTEKMTEEEKIEFISKLNITLMTEEPEKTDFLYFAADGKDRFAVSANNREESRLSVYKEDGTFLYGYAFKKAVYTMNFENENVLIFFHEENILATVDEKANVLELKKVPQTEENREYLNEYYYIPDKYVNGNEYHGKNHLGILEHLQVPFCQIIKIDSVGNKTVLYDFSAKYLTSFAFKALGVFAFVALVIFILYVIIKKSVQKGKAFNEIPVQNKQFPENNGVQLPNKPKVSLPSRENIIIRRLVAGVIDFIIIVFLSSVIILIVSLGNPSLNWVTVGSYLGSFATLYVVKDYCFKNASIGKKLLKLKIVDKSGKGKVTFGVRLKRAVTLILNPIEILLIIIQNVRIGDMWSKSEVVGE